MFDKYWNNWVATISIVAVLNFVVFVVVAITIGGDALNGKIEGGHYFLASHGVYTEVSDRVFTYSRLHAISMVITHLLAFVSCGISYLKKSRSKN